MECERFLFVRYYIYPYLPLLSVPESRVASEALSLIAWKYIKVAVCIQEIYVLCKIKRHFPVSIFLIDNTIIIKMRKVLVFTYRVNTHINWVATA